MLSRVHWNLILVHSMSVPHKYSITTSTDAVHNYLCHKMSVVSYMTDLASTVLSSSKCNAGYNEYIHTYAHIHTHTHTHNNNNNNNNTWILLTLLQTHTWWLFDLPLGHGEALVVLHRTQPQHVHVGADVPRDEAQSDSHSTGNVSGFMWASLSASGYMWAPLSASGYMAPLPGSGYMWAPLLASGYMWAPLPESAYMWAPLSASGYMWAPLSASGYMWAPLLAGGYMWAPLLVPVYKV